MSADAPLRRCPRCDDVWPASAPRCLRCGHSDGGHGDAGGPRPSVVNVLIFAFAVVAGLGFVLFHNQRRREENPPLQTQPTVAPPPSDATALPPVKPKFRACGLTPLDIDRFLGPARLAALDACNAHHAHIHITLDKDGQCVSVDSTLPAATHDCIVAALGSSTSLATTACTYQLK